MTGQHSRSKRLEKALAAAIVIATVTMVLFSNWRDAHRSRDRFTIAPAIGAPGAPRTSREDLAKRITMLEERLAARPDDSGAAVLLADALIRQARVTANAALAQRAEQALDAALRDDPTDYDALRMQGAVYLSQHRFKEALAIAERTRTMRPHDAWSHGVAGDAYIELGDYDKAFDAFDTMVKMRPSAAAYARVAYARELQGNLHGALQAMEMAAEATTPHDPEAQAWHFVQIGHLYFQMARLDEARRAFEHADFVFPGHPYALNGLARVKAAEDDYRGALLIYRSLLEKGATPELAAHVGDLYRLLGNAQEAERHYLVAETLEREGWKLEEPQPAALARFLADRDRDIPEAVRLAEKAARSRHDIFTDDALAWAYFKAGRIGEALAASERARRTGTRDRRILYHGAAIARAAGDDEKARELVMRALDGHPSFDVIAAREAAALKAELDRAVQVASR